MNTAIRTTKTSARKREFLVIFCMSYPFFLMGALAERVLPQQRAMVAMRRRRSIFAEASATASRTLPYAF